MSSQCAVIKPALICQANVFCLSITANQSTSFVNCYPLYASSYRTHHAGDRHHLMQVFFNFLYLARECGHIGFWSCKCLLWAWTGHKLSCIPAQISPARGVILMRLSSLISPFPIAICASVLLGTPVYVQRAHTHSHTLLLQRPYSHQTPEKSHVGCWHAAPWYVWGTAWLEEPPRRLKRINRTHVLNLVIKSKLFHSYGADYSEEDKKHT